MIEQFTNLTANGTALMLLVIKLGVVFVIAVTYWKSKAMIPTVVAVILGGFVWWSVNNVDNVSSKVEEDLGTPAQIYELPVVDEPGDIDDFGTAA